MNTVEEIRHWLNRDDTWSEAFVNYDKRDVAFNVLSKTIPIIATLETQNTLLKSALMRIAETPEGDVSYQEEAIRIATEALNDHH